jgi:uncharacterized Fe-S cluster-containing radical SAM superfamily protein
MTEDRFNYILQRAYRLLRKPLLESRAALRREAFVCTALQGESIYNICVNSDMTVSCNCQDYDGAGHIGDLKRETLSEVFASEKARFFRGTLAGGSLPILTCASCSELTMVPAAEARRLSEQWKVCTRGIMVENTVSCPYRCTACYRSVVLRRRGTLHMSLDDIRSIASTIRQHGIEHLSFFNLGETFAAPGVCDQLRIIRDTNPGLYILISTNGMMLDSDAKREAAMLANHIIFSIHGADTSTVTRYQRGGNFPKAYENMRKLVLLRDALAKDSPIVEWKYLLFNWNDRKRTVQRAIRLGSDAGVDRISFCPTSNPLYGISWRYLTSPFFRSLGELTWKGRELRFDRQCT